MTRWKIGSNSFHAPGPAQTKPVQMDNHIISPVADNWLCYQITYALAGEKIIKPENVKQAAGGQVKAQTVPGQAKVSGDSIKNDTVKTKQPEGTIIVPRTKADDKKKTVSFVQATLAKRGRK